MAMNLRSGVDRRLNLFIERGMTVVPSAAASAAYLLVLALSAVVRVLDRVGVVEVGGGAGVADGDFE